MIVYLESTLNPFTLQSYSSSAPELTVSDLSSTARAKLRPQSAFRRRGSSWPRTRPPSTCLCYSAHAHSIWSNQLLSARAHVQQYSSCYHATHHRAISEATLSRGGVVEVCERLVAVVSTQLSEDEVDGALEVRISAERASPHEPIGLGEVLAAVNVVH
jgi:hypothetical protein